MLRKLGTIAAGLLALCAAGAADAQTTPATPATDAKPASWWDTFAVSGHVEAGLTLNTVKPADGNNFGNLFGDRANTLLLNQAMLTVQRPLDPKATGFDFGFKFQGYYGSDARYTHFLGVFDEAINELNQIDIVEANLLLHVPGIGSGGMDVKAGMYPSILGAEVIPAPDNPLYSHSYIFNFGVPFKNTGVLTTTHLTDVIDIYAGIDTGVNTSLGCCSAFSGDNNNAVAFNGGIGLNLLGGNLTILAATHIGAENPNNPTIQAACNCDPNSAARYLNDITATWKVNDKLTLITDLNYIRDDAFHVDGGGIAQYVTYAINDVFKIAARAEVWRDGMGFFVASYPNYLNFVQIEHGDPNGLLVSGGNTTYGEFTLGLNITPPVPSNPVVKAFIIRPEVRVDTSLNGTTPFAAGTRGSQVTFAADAIIKF